MASNVKKMSTHQPDESNQKWYLTLPHHTDWKRPSSPLPATTVQALLAFGVINKRIPLFVFDLKHSALDSAPSLPAENWESVLRARFLSRANENWEDEMGGVGEIVVRGLIQRGFGGREVGAVRERWSMAYKLEKAVGEYTSNRLPAHSPNAHLPRSTFLANSFIALIKDAVDALRILYPGLVVPIPNAGVGEGELEVGRLWCMREEGEKRRAKNLKLDAPAAPTSGGARTTLARSSPFLTPNRQAWHAQALLLLEAQTAAGGPDPKRVRAEPSDTPSFPEFPRRAILTHTVGFLSGNECAARVTEFLQPGRRGDGGWVSEHVVKRPHRNASQHISLRATS